MRGVVLIVVSVGLTACGSGDTAAVRSVFDRLDAAQARGDARTACESIFLVAEEGREESEHEEEEEEEEGEESPEACRTAFASAATARKAQVKHLRTTVKSVEVHGDEATATLRSEVTRADGSTFANVYERDLVRRDGKWRIRISPEG